MQASTPTVPAPATNTTQPTDTPTTQESTPTVPAPATSTTQPTDTPTRTPTVTPSAADFEAQVLVLISQQRTQNGCVPLTVDPRLRTAAYLDSQDMAVANFFSHTGSNGSTPAQRISAQGYVWNTWGENVASGQASP